MPLSSSLKTRGLVSQGDLTTFGVDGVALIGLSGAEHPETQIKFGRWGFRVGEVKQKRKRNASYDFPESKNTIFAKGRDFV